MLTLTDWLQRAAQLLLHTPWYVDMGIVVAAFMPSRVYRWAWARLLRPATHRYAVRPRSEDDRLESLLRRDKPLETYSACEPKRGEWEADNMPAHFYTPTGEVVLGLREARKVGGLPSATTVLQIIAAEALTQYIVKQTLMAALTLPRQEGEPDDSYVGRIVRDSQQHRDQAAEWGTAMHELCAGYCQWRQQGDPCPEAPESHAPGLDAFRCWYEQEVAEALAVESALVGDGYGGRADLIYRATNGELAVADYKTQGTRPGQAARMYDRWPLQLAAYAHAYGASPLPGRLVSVVISSTEPGRLDRMVWREPAEHYYRLFRHALALWCYQNRYWPSGPEYIVPNMGPGVMGRWPETPS